MTKNCGFTLIEVLLTTVVLAMTLVGVLAVFGQCLNGIEGETNFSTALSTAAAKLEEIRNHNFSTIVADYAPGGAPGNTFTAVGLNSLGTVDINNANPNLLRITVNLCWRQRKGHIYGEDLNLNGRIDPGEDSDADGILDSPVQLITLMSVR